MNKLELTNELRKLNIPYNNFQQLWRGQSYLTMIKKCDNISDALDIIECQTDLHESFTYQISRIRDAISKQQNVNGTRTVSDDDVIKVYLNKKDNAKKAGVDFSLSFTTVKNMLRAKKCAFSGLPIHRGTFSIDRIDNKKGYVKGNVVACHCTFNKLKGIIEDKNNDVTFKSVMKAMKKIKKSGLMDR